MLNLNDLSEAQRRAVMHAEGPAMVLAGPGSGKTHLIVSRIRYLLEQRQAEPDNILVITFTKAAALSMERRFTDSTDGKFPGVRFGTFHSFFYQILKEYDSYDNQSLFTTEEKRHYLKGIFADLGIPWESGADYSILFAKRDSTSDAEENFAELSLPEGMTEEQAGRIRQAFREESYRDKKLDFDDMADLVRGLFQQKPGVLRQLQKTYQYVLVDEYQDTNRKQEQVLAMLIGNGGQIMAVGDDDQAIYGFRGSKPDVMKQFAERYPGAKVYYLERNYRSTPQIVQASCKVIGENKNRFLKNLCSEKADGEAVRVLGFESREREFDYVVKQIRKRKQDYKLSDMAVIVRTNREVEAVALCLQKEAIPCFVKENTKGLSEHFLVKEFIQCMEYVVWKRDRAPGVWNRLGGEENKRRMLEKLVPSAALHFIWKTMGYEKMLKRKAGELARREGVAAETYLEEWQGIFACLAEHAGQYACTGEWLKEVAGGLGGGSYEGVKQKGKNPADKSEGTSEAVSLLTMHGCKGLEFSYVCILNVNEGNIPGKKCRSEEEIEEERRLLYVAMTRAKKVLDILYLTGNREHPRLPSRFLNVLLGAKD